MPSACRGIQLWLWFIHRLYSNHIDHKAGRKKKWDMICSYSLWKETIRKIDWCFGHRTMLIKPIHRMCIRYVISFGHHGTTSHICWIIYVQCILHGQYPHTISIWITRTKKRTKRRKITYRRILVCKDGTLNLLILLMQFNL